MNSFKSISSQVLSILITFFISFAGAVTASGQNFIKITDTNNPIVTDFLSGGYFGTSWIDIDNDRKLDLFVNRKAVYKNLGGGNFTVLETAMGNQLPNLGNSWSDYNNDGFIDCFVVSTGGPYSFLYRNEGGGIMTKINTGK